MPAPRKASVDGLHGLPAIKGESVRVIVDGDMLRGVVSYDCDEGWADILEWDDDGKPLHNGEYYVTRRIHGVVEARTA